MPERPSDKYIPYYFVLFFVLLAILLFWFAHLAISTNPGVTTENAYVDGIKYNETIAKAEEQEKLGWKGDINLEGQNLSFKFADKDNNPITNAIVKAYVSDPQKEGNDKTLSLTPLEKGVYQAQITNMIGARDIHINAEYQGKNFQKSKRFVIR